MEAAKVIQSQEGFSTLMERYNAWRVTPPPLKLTDIPCTLTNMQKQGDWTPEQPCEHASIKTHLLRHVGVWQTPHIPDVDIVAPSNNSDYIIQIGLAWPNPPDADLSDIRPIQHYPLADSTAYVYQPSGHFLGGIYIDRLHYLTHTYAHHAQNHPDLSLGSLEADIARLLRRHRPTTHKTALTTTTEPISARLNKIWALHPSITTALAPILDSLALTTPLLAPTSNTTTYISPFLEDQLFGCCHADIFTYMWSGFMGIVSPSDPDAQVRIIRWALSSVSSTSNTTDTLVTLFLPHQSNTDAHNSLLQHPSVLTLDTISPTDMPTHDDTQSWTSTPAAPGLKKPKHGVRIILIGNQSGFDTARTRLATAWPAYLHATGRASETTPDQLNDILMSYSQRAAHTHSDHSDLAPKLFRKLPPHTQPPSSPHAHAHLAFGRNQSCSVARTLPIKPQHHHSPL